MSVSEYVATFTKKMKPLLYLVPTKLSKVDKFANVLPVDFGPMVKIEKTLKEAIWPAKIVETHIRDKVLEKEDIGDKRKLEGSSRSDKKNKFSKSDPNNKKYKRNNESKWCDKCKKNHFV